MHFEYPWYVGVLLAPFGAYWTIKNALKRRNRKKIEDAQQVEAPDPLKDPNHPSNQP